MSYESAMGMGTVPQKVRHPAVEIVPDFVSRVAERTAQQEAALTEEPIVIPGPSAGMIALWVGSGLVVLGGIGYLVYDFIQKKKEQPAPTG